jgi:hypothetical protein
VSASRAYNINHKMEPIDKKMDRIRGDVSELISLYDYAERLYPYTNLREPRKVPIYPSNPNHSLTSTKNDAIRWLSTLTETAAATSMDASSGVSPLWY